METLFKKSFTIFEIILAVVIIGILISSVNINLKKPSKLEIATKQLIIHLNYTRKLALEDDKFDYKDPFWFRKRWTLKFKKCSKNIGGIYYVVYSDENKKGQPNKDESIKDPLTNKYLYSNYDCNPSDDENRYILLTKEFQIEDVIISCNKTSSLGQISFGAFGEPYSKLSTNKDEAYFYKLEKRCTIELFTKDKSSKIYIEPITGFVHQ